MTIKSFRYREQAAKHAQKMGSTNFRTWQDKGSWFFRSEPGMSPAWEWAQGKDFVAWVETTYENGIRSGVVIMRCRLEELSPEEHGDLMKSTFIIEPITPELFADPDAESKARKQSTSTTGKGSQTQSKIESPVKFVWDMADSMKGATRREVIAACVAAGVHKATSSAQYYRWQKAQK